jgi:tRNA-dihydrouridine synthase
MEDITDTVFRQLIAGWAPPDVFFTEFVNVDGMCSPGREEVIHRLRYCETERPIVAQVWGLDPENFERAARDIRLMGFDGIDLNMGCPVRKIVKSGACSALIENRSLADEIITATKEGSAGMPVSVKTRIGFKSVVTVEWIAFLLEHELAAITVHGRTAKSTAAVPADWNEIGKAVLLRDEMRKDTLVIGNGDVTKPEQILEFAETHRVDGVMVGRGAYRDPLIFREPGSAGFDDLSAPEKIDRMVEHLSLHKTVWGGEKNFNAIKKFARTYINGFPGASRLRSALMDAHSHEEMIEILNSSQSGGRQ